MWSPEVVAESGGRWSNGCSATAAAWSRSSSTRRRWRGSTAIRPAGAGGAIVNVSSHQARRAVRGALPYATAKAAIEGLTRALAVDYGPRGIRVNAVALGSIATERYQAFLDEQAPAAAAPVQREIGRPP